MADGLTAHFLQKRYKNIKRFIMKVLQDGRAADLSGFSPCHVRNRTFVPDDEWFCGEHFNFFLSRFKGGFNTCVGALYG